MSLVQELSVSSEEQSEAREFWCSSRNVNYTNVTEIPSGEVVTAGKFLVNQHPAVVLFDSGALHSFMSLAFASKYNQKELQYPRVVIALVQLEVIFQLIK